MSDTTTVEGTLEQVVYSNEEGSWSVVRVDVPGERGLTTAVGNLQGTTPGETLRLTGAWEKNPKFGRQFRVESYLAIQPSTLVGIERYLGSGLIPGIGPKMAERLVATFGLDTLEVIENHPERLKQVPGIGPKRRAEIRRAWAEQRRIKDLMVFLQSHGVSTRYALKIYKMYGDEAMGLVRRDPYRLARDIRGIGFLTADRIASSMGVPKDAPTRIQAGVLHLLDQASGEGHVFLPRDELLRETVELLGVEPERVAAAVDVLVKEEELEVEPLPAGAGGGEAGGEAVYPTALWAAETGVLERVEALLDHPARKVRLDVEKALEWFQQREGIELAPEQRRAVSLGLTEKVLVITGGPGTGKTTLVRAVVDILLKKSVKILLAAPTGRAAKRLSEATGMEARTIHRLLEFNAQTRHFERNAERPLTADLVILDEVSMLDVNLAWQMLRAVPDKGRLVLVGDVDQLPSVGPGRVLGDLIASGVLPVVRLSTIFRQARRSLIVVNAHRVNQGEMPVLDAGKGPTGSPEGDDGDGGAGGDFFFIPRSDPEEALETVCYLVTERIPSSFGLDPVEDIQVLTPMNRGALGAERLNAELKERLNPARPGTAEVARGSRSFRAGDKVMQIRNNYDLGVFNGDVGRIDAIDEEEGEVLCTFDDQRVTHELSSLDELVPAYACSIHKSQGSEYPCVVLPFHSQHWVMLRRNLLYTALTRARELVVVVGETRALGRAVRSSHSDRRWSLLAERLARRLTERAGSSDTGRG